MPSVTDVGNARGITHHHRCRGGEPNLLKRLFEPNLLQAQEMHRFIRETVLNSYGSEIASNLSLLYGGSCKPSNAKELFANEDVDGGLIGGASLNADDFIAIANSF